ncbi:hypothetical protein AAE478_000207 [Parahypoxylon ruwenzoriense]
MSTDNGVGPLVRLWGLRTEQLPATTASADELAPFLAAIVREAAPFIDSAAPKPDKSSAPDEKKKTTLWKHKGVPRSHPDSAVAVQVLERVVSAKELERVAGGGGVGKKVSPETWCCRRSVHEDAARPGTASWAEFERCFRERHPQSEQAFTPACVAAHRAIGWDCGGVEVEEEEGDDGGGGGPRPKWSGFGLEVVEMRHRIGRPLLRDRTFPVLQMTCAATTGAEARGEEFLVVSIPVPDFGTASRASELAAEKGAQIARYVSVERVRRLDGDGECGDAWSGMEGCAAVPAVDWAGEGEGSKDWDK